jgi:multidrug efflux pump subunit AcrA (membrane-fusion protein)
MYAQVRLTPSNLQATIRIPANTLLFDSKGTRVAVVDSRNVVHLRVIKEGRDFGSELEVLTGVQAGDQLITNPTDDLKDGVTVRIGGK